MKKNDLQQYIIDAIKEGKSKEEVYKELLIKGYKLEEIESSFVNANKYIATSKKADDFLEKRVINIILVAGSLFIGLGIFSFIAVNWQNLSRFTKFLIIIISMKSVYFMGWFVKNKFNYKSTGNVLILLGNIIYGAAIFLIGQIFNVKVYWPEGFVLWMIGVVIMGLLLDSYLILNFSVLLGFLVSYILFFFLIEDSNINISLSVLILFIVASMLTLFVAIEMRKRLPEEIKNLF